MGVGEVVVGDPAIALDAELRSSGIGLRVTGLGDAWAQGAKARERG
jgi:hypothetical protein